MAYYQTDIRDSDPMNDHFSGQSDWRGREKTSTGQGFTPSILRYFQVTYMKPGAGGKRGCDRGMW